MTSENKIQKTANITLEPSSSHQPLNKFYESFSNSLLRVSSESITPKAIAPKVSVVASPSIASTSAATTLLAFKPTIHNIKPITTTTIQRPEGNTIMVGNKQYQLVRRPLNQVKTVTVNQASNNILIRPNPEGSVKVT